MGRTLGGSGEPGRGFWGIRLNADDNPLDREMDRETDVRAEALRKLDRLVAEGFTRDAAIRWLEDKNRMRRGALLKLLQG